MGATRPSFVLVLPLVLLAATVRAQPLPEEKVPSPLRPWVPWALDGADDRLCPAVEQQAVCLWPGRLALDLGGTGGSFALEAFADRTLDVPLPGGDKHWPLGVLVDGRPASLVEKEGSAWTRVTPGAHRLQGHFAWDRLPDSLDVPRSIGIVDLVVDGQPHPLARREEDGLLLLRQGGAALPAGENIELKVFRQVIDGIPLVVNTRLVVEASGRAREISVQGALLAGAVPLAVSGQLPARLDPDGRLRLQVRAGTFSVSVRGRMTERGDMLRLPKAAPPWPAQEVWVFTADASLREVEPQGPPSIDPSRTDLPEDWRGYPAFLMEGDASLALKEVRRGEPDAAPDQIDLRRQIWLDIGGRGFTVRDSFGGRSSRTSRLNLLPPATLGRASVDGEGQLVTADPEGHGAGVEVRKAALALQADSRLARTGAMRAVGWGTAVHSLQAAVYLPPGWRLLGASGVDHVSGTWLSRWNLLGFFLVLLTALAAQKLLGIRWALGALLTLVLIHGEPGAPALVWLFILAGIAAMRAPSPGLVFRGGRLLWAGALVVLVLTQVDFVTDQVRSGLFPSLAPPETTAPAFAVAGLAGQAVPADELEAKKAVGAPGYTRNAPAGTAGRPAPRPAAPPAREKAEADNFQSQAESAPEQTVPNSLSFKTRTKAYEQDPHAVIQTGSGVPNWTWASHVLSWSGPVSADQRMHLFLLPPSVNLLLALLRVLLSTLLGVRLAASGLPALEARLGPRFLVGGLLVFCCLLAPSTRADEPPALGSQGGLFPSTEMLGELKERLTRPPACAPRCVTTAELRLSVEGGELLFEAEVHAAAKSSWAVPGPAGSWVPRSVSVDGQSAEGLLGRLPDGFLHLRLQEGVHHVRVGGPMGADSLTVQFKEKPHRASVSAPGFQVDGIHDDGTADPSVQVSRLVPGTGAARTGVYEPWLEVQRVFNIGVSWGVETIVRRVSPPGAPVVVKVPLLKGMLVTDSEHQAKDGEVLVTLGPQETMTRWSATLVPGENETVTLKAPSAKPWSEVWTVNCGPVWECRATGLPPVAWLQEGRLATEFRPWPGETLSLRFRRPAGIEGQTTTIDKASLQLAPGQRLEDATLDLTVRASRPQSLMLLLPDGSEIQELKVWGKDQPIRPDAGKLPLAIERGEGPVHVAWREPGGLRTVHRGPELSLGLPAVDVDVTMQLPEDRWILLVGGPSWGPHVLYWAYLLVVLLGAAVLGRLPGSPLRGGEWFLLALGLTQIAPWQALIVAGWFLVFSWRRGRELSRPLFHDGLQLGLVLWTLLALLFLYEALRGGLLLRPDMQVGGGGSSDVLLRWYEDRIAGPLPRPWVVSVPLWVYKGLMLAWALWLASRITAWTVWAWECFTSGSVWKRVRKPPTPASA
jgi:hypothetical protein